MSNKPFESMNKGELLKVLRELDSIFKKMEEQCDNSSNLSKEIQEHHDNANHLSTEIQEHHDNASNFSKEIQQKNKELNELTKKIEGLLPGATSAALASSYKAAQANWIKEIFYWIGFIGSLGILIWGYFYYLIVDIPPENLEWKTIVIRATVGLPLIWIAWYFQRLLSQIKRIKEEYHHKERVMRVYEGFSKQIEKTSD